MEFAESNSLWEAMLAASKDQLKAQTSQAEVRGYQDARTNKAFMACGDKSGRGFSFIDGDVLEVPSLDDILLRMKEIQFTDRKANLLSFSAKLGRGWAWVPVWVLRKKTPSRVDETPALRDDVLYQDILAAENDLARIELFAGKTWRVKESTVTLTDPKTSKEYDLRIWTLVEIKKAAKKN